MAGERGYGLSKQAAGVFRDMAAKHRQRLPDVGRRTRRVWNPRSPGSDGSGPTPSAGCCAGCIDCRYMTAFHSIFAPTYYASPIPNLLIPGNEADDGDGELSLEYIGVSDGLDGVADGHPYWESDTFTYTCGDSGVFDTYLWRMYSMALETADCHTENSDEMVGPYIVRVGSATVCDDLTAANCGSACGSGGEYGDCAACPEATLITGSDTMVTTAAPASLNGPTFSGDSVDNVGCVWWSGTVGTPADYSGGTYYASLDLDTGVFEITINDDVDGAGTATYTGTVACNGAFTMTKTASTGSMTWSTTFTLTGAV